MDGNTSEDTVYESESDAFASFDTDVAARRKLKSATCLNYLRGMSRKTYRLRLHENKYMCEHNCHDLQIILYSQLSCMATLLNYMASARKFLKSMISFMTTYKLSQPFQHVPE